MATLNQDSVDIVMDYDGEGNSAVVLRRVFRSVTNATLNVALLESRGWSVHKDCPIPHNQVKGKEVEFSYLVVATMVDCEEKVLD